MKIDLAGDEDNKLLIRKIGFCKRDAKYSLILSKGLYCDQNLGAFCSFLVSFLVFCKG